MNTENWYTDPSPALVLGLALVLASGCGGKESGGNRSPIFNTGVNATVIEPGGSLPAMPPPGVSSRSAPGSYNQSSRGGAQTHEPSQTTSQGGARISPPGGYSNPPVGGETPGAIPGAPRAAYPGGPGYPPPTGGGMVSIGGATTIDTRQDKREMKPFEAMSRNPLLWPVAMIAWPFQKIAGSVKGSADRSHSGGPQSAPPPLSPEELDQLHDRHQTLAMERALDSQRVGAVGATPDSQNRSPVPPTHLRPRPPERWSPAGAPSAGSSATPSIAEELAALRRGLATGGVATPTQLASRNHPNRLRDVPTESRAASPNDGNVGVRSAGDDRFRQRFDDDGDGRLDREEIYDDEGLIAESAEDASGDGRFDTWTRYRDGAPMRRRSDLDGDGLIDAWTYYAAGGLDVARLERDTNGDGYRDQIDFFDAGRLARRTEDPDGDGFPDRVTRFAPDGRPSERDEDSDGDGAMDTRSFYESGRLVRRILLNEDERWEP
jgi:hypothetical protein